MKKTGFWMLAMAASFWMGCEPSSTGNGGTGTDTTKHDSVPAPQVVAPEFNSPEGVATDGEFLYISNLGVKPEATVKDGDGRIMKVSKDLTNWVDKDKWAALKLDAPKGMAVVGKMLYVTDIDRLVVIDLKKVEQTFVYDFSRFKTQFLNDIAVMNDTTLLVSSTDANAIFKVNLKDQNFEKMKTGELNGPNGLLYSSEDGKIYCVEYGAEKKPGRVLAIDAATGAIKQLGKHLGGLDGVALTADGSLMFSDWATAHLEKMDIATGKVTQVVSDSIQGPADFYYDTATKKTYLPKMLENGVAVMEGN